MKGPKCPSPFHIKLNSDSSVQVTIPANFYLLLPPLKLPASSFLLGFVLLLPFSSYSIGPLVVAFVLPWSCWCSWFLLCSCVAASSSSLRGLSFEVSYFLSFLISSLVGDVCCWLLLFVLLLHCTFLLIHCVFVPLHVLVCEKTYKDWQSVSDFFKIV